jgi:hypothetical protein
MAIYVIIIGSSLLAAFGVLALTGFPRTQRALMISALLLALLTVLLDQLQTTTVAGVGRLLATVACLFFGFAAWNLVARPGSRWPYRVVIYTVYAASFQLMNLVLLSPLATDRIARTTLTAAAIYTVASVAIVIVKPWFARRMAGEMLPHNRLPLNTSQ